MTTLIAGCERYFIASQPVIVVFVHVIVDDPSLELAPYTQRVQRERNQHIIFRSAIVLYVPTPQLTKY